MPCRRFGIYFFRVLTVLRILQFSRPLFRLFLLIIVVGRMDRGPIVLLSIPKAIAKLLLRFVRAWRHVTWLGSSPNSLTGTFLAIHQLLEDLLLYQELLPLLHLLLEVLISFVLLYVVVNLVFYVQALWVLLFHRQLL